MNGEETPEDRHQRERVGVSGDPVPDHEYGDSREDLTPDVDPGEQYEDVSPSVHRAARDLAAYEIVSERQALAWVLREVEGVGREEAAERLGCSVSNLDTLRGRARDNINHARQTVSIVDELLPDE